MTIVEISELKKQYSRKKVALNGIDLTFESGKIIGLLGSNSSGKTTLIKCMAGLLTPNHGKILIGGEPVGAKSKAMVSYLPDVSYIKNYQNISQLLQIFQDYFPDFQRDVAISMLDSLDIDVNAKYKTLSKGNKEKVQLILVMSRKAQLYLLDEPLAAVDPATRDFILNMMLKNYQESSTILIATHLISDIETLMDQVIFLKNGEIDLISTVDDIRQQQEMSVDDYFRGRYSYETTKK